MTRDVPSTLTLFPAGLVWNVSVMGTGSKSAVSVIAPFMVTLADFGIEQPHVATVLSIAETGVIELQLFLSRA